MNNQTVFLFAALMFLSCVLMYAYYYSYQQHQYQLNKINFLEYKYREKQREIDTLANMTKPCPVNGLNTPRTCYFGSNYACSWNEKIGRCDAN